MTRWVWLVGLLAVGLWSGIAEGQGQGVSPWCGGGAVSNPTCPIAPAPTLACPLGGYCAGALVKFNGTVFICNTNCTANVSPGDPAGFFWNAMSGANQWNNATTYAKNAFVMRAGTVYTALLDVPVNVNPSANPQYWIASSAGKSPVVTPIGNTGVDIQNAINAAPTGGIVQLACETYTITTTISITKALTLRGCGTGVRLLGAPAGSAPIGTVLNGSGTLIAVNTTNPVVIEYLQVQGSGSLITFTASSQENSGSTINQVGFYGGSIGLNLTNSRQMNIINSIFAAQTANGIKIDGSFNPDDGYFNIVNNMFQGSGTGNAIEVVNASAVNIIGNHMITWGARGIWIRRSVAGAMSQYQIIGNQITPAVDGAFGLVIDTAGAGSGAVEISGNYIDCFNGPSGSGPSAVPCVILHTVFNLTFTGNAMRLSDANGSGGVSADNLIGANFTGNSIDAPAGATPPNTAGYAYNITSSSQTLVSSTNFVNSVMTSPYQGSAYTIVSNTPAGTMPFAGLPAASDGSQVWCTDCTPTTGPPCTTGGGGALAIRQGGGWRCL